MRDLIKVFKSLSDESRLRVLNLLMERECCVCEVEQVMEISQSKASRILSTLYDVGFLTHRKEGLWSLYSIDWEGMDPPLKGVLLATREKFGKNEQMEEDLKRLHNAERLSPCGTEGTCAGESIIEKVSSLQR